MSDANIAWIEAYRDYLLLIGRLQLSPGLAHKVDLSGVVQQTLWEASQAPAPEGSDSARLAWIRTLLANNLRDEIRKATAERRDVRRKVSLDAALEASSGRVAEWLASERSSPSQQAIRVDEIARLARALAQLADDQRWAIELHHLSGLPLVEVAAQLGRTREATASLIYRGLKKLRTVLQ